MAKSTYPKRSNNPVSRLKKRLQGKDVGIPVRPMGQTYDDRLPTLWFGDNGFLTAFFMGFSATLPEGEDQFIYSVRLFQDKITDPILKAQVRAFIGQEAHHSKEHDLLNNTMKARGFDLDRIEKMIHNLNKWMRKNQSPAKQLAGTVCGEHITALLADFALNDEEFARIVAEPTLTTWSWHAIEELEHKGVAFDVYDQLVGDRDLLRRTMVEMTLSFLLINTYNALRLMPQTGQMTNLKKWREAARFMGRMGRSIFSDYLDFYKKDYHPWDHDCRETLKKARARYLNEIAEAA